MFRLALHWQILIGMLLGSAIGLTLNLLASNRTVHMTQGLPDGIHQVTIRDSLDRIEIRYQGNDQRVVTRVIDPLSRSDNEFRTLEKLRASDPLAASLYESHGQSLAKRVGNACHRVGGLFLRMLQMVAVPLIVTSLLCGILGLAGGHGLGRMFAITIVYYLGTSMAAIVTGLLVVNAIDPGLGNRLGFGGAGGLIEQPDSMWEVLWQQLETIIPANPIGALAAPNYLSIIAFTIAFALFAVSVGDPAAERIRNMAKACFDVMMAMTMAIIRLAPIGVLFLMIYVTATHGGQVFRALGWYVATVAAGLAIHAFVTLPIVLMVLARRRPDRFGKAMSPALLTAFSSASSNATLPLTLSCVETRAGVSNKTASFVLPMGATLNMDGTALYEAVAVLFIAQVHTQMDLPLTQQILVAITALLASIGAAGIPHAGLVTMAIVLHTVGLPLEMQGIILAVDRILDMARTAVNVWSDSCGCAVVEQLVWKRRRAKAE